MTQSHCPIFDGKCPQCNNDFSLWMRWTGAKGDSVILFSWLCFVALDVIRAGGWVLLFRKIIFAYMVAQGCNQLVLSFKFMCMSS